MNSFREQILSLGFRIKSKCREYRNTESKEKNVNEKWKHEGLRGGLCSFYGIFYNVVSIKSNSKILTKIFVFKNTE